MVEETSEATATRDYGEIELIDYINVLCKWKRLILGGTLFCILIAAVVSFMLLPIYRIDTLIEIGSVVNESGKAAVVERPESLLAKIKNGVYEKAIREKAGIDAGQKFPIKVENPKNTSLIKIWMESSRKEEAGEILNVLNQQIIADHEKFIDIERSKFNQMLQVLENKSSFLEKEKANILAEQNLTRKSREQLQEAIKDARERLEGLDRKKTRMKKQAKKNALALLLINNEIEESRRYLNELQDRLNIGLEKEKAALKRRHDENESTIKSLILEKDRLNQKMKNLQNARVVKKVTSSDAPVRPKIQLNLLLSGTGGLFLFVFLAFFLEYLQCAREREGLTPAKRRS